MISRALVLGLAFQLCFFIIPPGLIILPLFDVGSISYCREILLALVFFNAAVLITTGFKKWQFLLFSSMIVLGWISNYSVTKAFYPHVALLCLYAFLCEGETEQVKKELTLSFFSGVFLASGLAKMNPSFLSGAEFLSSGDFMAFLPKFTLSQNLVRALSMGAVAGELLLALLVWVWPVLAINLGIIFILFLTLIHQHVFFVYLCFLVFYFQMSPPKKRPLFENPFFWIAVILWTRPSSVRGDYSLSLSLVTLTLLGLHVNLIRKNAIWEKVRITGVKGLVPFFLVMLTFFLKLLDAPAPMGYHMFSGTRSAYDMYELRSSTPDFCYYFRRNFRSSVATDTDFKMDKEKINCVLKHPTESGMYYAKREICRLIPNTEWTYKKRGENVTVGENCASYGK